ncbi:AMSH-like ubiquitin thioesterase 2 [Citrus sinensis]|uniref:AMSH-like ubiquitin thioesterase 2 n=1 Tax=Citrus sinensis TaxID=2711 RepID=A0ACB8LJ31_CITSI|nr:AMSH-like ubiquitin thioesterase 2 [Citrus sinensis]
MKKSPGCQLSSVDSISSCSPYENLSPMSLHTISEWPCAGRVTAHAVTLSSPSPALFLTAKAPQGALVTHVSVADSDKQSNTEPSVSNVLQDVHISAQLMEDFLELAKENTDKDLETCGVLGAFLVLYLVHLRGFVIHLMPFFPPRCNQENGTFYVTTLIIPKQDSTSSSCQALNEEDVFAIQNDRSLFPMGWIHMMVPEAFAIVLAPTDSSRSYGIFRLTEPSGMSVLKECQETGFHPHKEPADGSPIYEHCSHVYTNSNLRLHAGAMKSVASGPFAQAFQILSSGLKTARGNSGAG